MAHKPADSGEAYSTRSSPAVGARQPRPEGLRGTGPDPGVDPSPLTCTG